MNDPIESENKQTYELFKSSMLDEILEFTNKHSVEIIRGEDWQYGCFIDKVCYYNALTFLNALIVGMIIYKQKKK